MRERTVTASGHRVNTLAHNAAVASHTMKYPYAVPDLNPAATQAALVAAMAAIPAHVEAPPFGREAPHDSGELPSYIDEHGRFMHRASPPKSTHPELVETRQPNSGDTHAFSSAASAVGEYVDQRKGVGVRAPFGVETDHPLPPKVCRGLWYGGIVCVLLF